LRACDLVNKVTIDIKQACAIVGFVGYVGIPDFIIERFGGHGPLPYKCEIIGVFERAGD